MGLLKCMLGTPSVEELAREIIKAATPACESSELFFNPEKLRIEFVGSQRHINLHNIHQEYCSAGPLLRRTLICRYVQMLTAGEAQETPAAFRDAQANVLPRVRERAYYGLIELWARVEGMGMSDIVHRPFGEHLALELVYDMPDAIASISKETLEEWGVGFDLVLDVACQNLLEGSGGKWESPTSGLYVSPWRDNHDCARLILLDLIRSLDVKGDHVAMVPHRDTLIVTGSEDVKGLEKMADLTEAAMSQARFMTPIPVRLEWDKWVPFRLPEGHPLYPRFELLRAQSISRDYEEQKQWLIKIHGEDIFIAAYTATQHEETGRTSSYCVWSKDVVTLLPKADMVYFFDGDKPGDEHMVAIADWNRVNDIVGDLMAPQEMYRERYLVESFPAQDQLAQLGKLPH